MVSRKFERIPSSPNRQEEEALLSSGYRRIAGIDEAGRGALAGPVVAAAVVLPPEASFDWLDKVRDSKLLQEEIREGILEMMHMANIEIGIGCVSPQVVDEINILNATKKAMKMALEQLTTPPDYILTDYVKLSGIRIPQKNITKGDRVCLSIACASIVAKVTRDRMMKEIDREYPEYGFASHKGYGTCEHLELLGIHGACRIHRLTFRPVRHLARLI